LSAHVFDFFIGFWLLSVAGLIIGLYNVADRKRTAFLLGLFIFSFLGTVPGCNFFPHYFVLMLPALALLAGMGSEFMYSLRLRFAKITLLIFPIVVLASNLWLQWPVLFGVSPQTLSQIIYRKSPFIESVKVGNYTHEHTGKDARVAVIGSEPEIYFYGQRHSATGYIYAYPLMENQPYAAAMQRGMISEIESAKPEYIIMVSNADRGASGNPRTWKSWSGRKNTPPNIMNASAL